MTIFLIITIVCFLFSLFRDRWSVGWRITWLAIGLFPLAYILYDSLVDEEMLSLILAVAITTVLYFLSYWLHEILLNVWGAIENSFLASGWTIAATATSILSTILGVILVNNAVASDLAEYPFWYNLTMAIPIVSGIIGLFWSIFLINDADSPSTFWEHILLICSFLITPAVIALGIGLAILLAAIVAGVIITSMVAILIFAFTGGTVICIIVFGD